MKVLVTGVAGFIGFNVAKALILRGDTVVGIDNVNDYYDQSLKEDRLEHLKKLSTESNLSFKFVRGDISNQSTVNECFQDSFDRVINLAAQAGVRKSCTRTTDNYKYYRILYADLRKSFHSKPKLPH